ncbi:MAG: NAD(P)-dependent oxidoreductase [Nitrososphaera sp.]|nr:NAD(P)-dependent oxidoreductase [Nitrososphaera sp.]
MKVLVTGGAGYLGSIISRKLLAKGHQVRVIDPLWYGRDPVQELMKDENFELMQEDIRDLTAVVKALKDVDAVLHLASIVGMPAANLDPRTSTEINYLATKNIAELCALYGIGTLVFMSTCSVYGAQPGRIITEKSSVSPLDVYAETKYRSEKSIYQVYEAPTIVRLGTLFGMSPRMRFDLAINLVLAKALNKEKITVFGGKQHRPFLHVADAADAVMFVLERNLDGIYNVISENFTIMEAAERISKLTGAEIEVSDTIVDKRDYVVSAEKIKQFGFVPSRNIEYAVEEARRAFENGKIKNYREPKYSNYDSLFTSKELQAKVYTQGPIFK